MVIAAAMAKRHMAIQKAQQTQQLQPCLLWCAKNAFYIQLWPLGRFKVEKSIKGVVKKLRPENALGHTLETCLHALIP